MATLGNSTIVKNRLNDFLSNHGLYREFKVVENYLSAENAYSVPIDFHGETFEYYCIKEESIKTFELKLPSPLLSYWGKLSVDVVPEELFDENGLLKFVSSFVGECQSCKEYSMHLLLHVRSDKSIPKRGDKTMTLNPATDEYVRKEELITDRANIYVEKIGVKPELQITIDKSISTYFDRESSNWYYKAQKLFSDNSGIGSFAYYRRIIEKELFKIVEDISKLQSTDKHLLKLLAEYKEDQKISSIYDNIFSLLPLSLQSLGVNPIKTLYKQTSEGLHSLTEKECLDRAEIIDTLLRFVVKKLNEEQSEILKMRNVLKKLCS